MPRILQGLRSFWGELVRRRVHRAGVIYLGGAFIAMQVAEIAVPALSLPDWALTLVVLLSITGFPVVMVVAWFFDVTPQGIRRSDAVARARRPALHALFGGLVIILSVVMAVSAWSLWLRPEQDLLAEASEFEEFDPRRLAVLYFDDHSPDRVLGHIADGFTEGLIHELTGVEGIHVTSRNGVKPFRDTNVPLDSIVATLKVGSLVEGSVTAVGDSLLATVQLIDGATLDHLDSRHFRALTDEVLDLRNSLMAEVALALRQRLGQEIRLRQIRAMATSSEAWSLVQQAEKLRDDEYGFLLDRDEEGALRTLDRMDSLLVRASRLDPEWPEPVYERALVAEDRARVVSPAAGGLDRAQTGVAMDLARRAAEMDESDGRPWAILGRLRASLAAAAPDADSAEALLAAAEADFRVAVDRSPRFADALGALSTLLSEQGRWAEARVAAERALEADAFLEEAPDITQQLFDSSLNLKDFAEARRHCDEGRRRFESDHRFVVCKLLLLVADPGTPPDVQRSWALVDSLTRTVRPSQASTFRTWGRLQTAKVAVRADMPDSASAILERAVDTPLPPVWAYDVAHLRLLTGAPRSEVISLLGRYLDWNPASRTAVARDWYFEELHDDPAFQALVAPS